MTVKVSAKDKFGIKQVELAVNGKWQTHIEKVAPYEFSIALAYDSTVTLKARVTDKSGLQTVSLRTVKTGPPPDTKPPALAFVGLQEGDDVSPELTVTVTASDKSGIAFVRLLAQGKL